MNHPLALATLRQLADGSWHSGEAMGAALGVTRATISNVIKDLDEAGVIIERARSRGYRLAHGFTPLDPIAIDNAYRQSKVWSGAAAPSLSLECVDRVTSTSTVLAERDVHPASGHVLTCEWQTQGRGRRGRSWLAPPGCALTFSLCWRFSGGAAALSGLSLAISVAVVEGLQEAGLPRAALRVKWPNDVLCAGGKLAGILIEATGDMLGPTDVIIGVGVNHALPGKTAEAIQQPVADIVSTCARVAVPPRSAVLGLLLAHLLHATAAFERDGFAAFRARWLALHAHAGKRVTVRDGDELLVGQALGVDAQGALMVDVAGRTRVLNAAEVLSP